MHVEDTNRELLNEPVKVYNFQVEDYHTYHVGNNGILVHNDRVGYGGEDVDVNKIKDTSSAPKKGGESVAGHELQKHAGRNPDIWGKVSGNSEKINKMAMQHINDIINGPGNFKVVESNGLSFLEKMLPDGRGIRLNMDGSFKGFIDQIR